VRALFDASIGQYDYSGMPGREISHSTLLIFHVFFSNILLMNYLIAILSTTYENMKQSGVFRYKVNLYQYCERFMTAFAERSFGEIILHPPPLSYLSALMVPFLVCPPAMVYIGKGFSYFMFWFENLIFIMVYLMFTTVLAPIAYIKIWINVIRNSVGVLSTILNIVLWAISGPFLTLFLIFRDVYYLIKILSYHQGCRFGKHDEMAEEKIEPISKVRIFNETRATVISLYKRLQKHMKQDQEMQDEEEDEFEFDPDFFHIEDDENMTEDFLYVVKKSLIIEEWKNRRTIIGRREQIRIKNQKFSDIGGLLASKFRKQLGVDQQQAKKVEDPEP
jgi:hypothetical protein